MSAAITPTVGVLHRGESGTDRRQWSRTRRVLAHELHRTSQPSRGRTDDHDGHVRRHVGKDPVDKTPAPDMGRGLVPAEPAAGPAGEHHQLHPGGHRVARASSTTAQ